MENIIESSVNAEPVGNVEPQQNEPIQPTNEPVNAGNGEGATPVVDGKPIQTKEDNAKFASIRREAEQRAKDAVIAEMYGSQGINTYADYQAAIQRQQREQEAAQKNIDPEFYGQFKYMEEKLNSIEREKTMLQQDQQLSNDPKVGSLYKEWKTEVKDLAAQYKVDLDTAFTILARERIADVMGKTKIQAEQEAIKGLQQNASTTPGSLSGVNQDIKQDFSKMASKDFEELTAKALRGELMKE